MGIKINDRVMSGGRCPRWLFSMGAGVRGVGNVLHICLCVVGSGRRLNGLFVIAACDGVATQQYCLVRRPPAVCVHHQVEVCVGMGKTGIPWVPWDSHGNGS